MEGNGVIKSRESIYDSDLYEFVHLEENVSIILAEAVVKTVQAETTDPGLASFRSDVQLTIVEAG